MQITKKLIIAGAGIVVLTAGGGAAYAATATAAAPVAPKVTAQQAIDTALKAVPGTWVSELDFDARGTKADAWELELTKGAEQYEVAVDAASGKVTHQEKSQADQDNQDDQDDDNDDD
ncbi:Peptidase propeptide and YPEB domain-containing protein [Nonomuraea solani]|uniref:Peptidase propeptide and YPEB domain-containing protein n=1 Tax=Nonomuraea solani TaxID=1144553 RepID=A0A1H5TY86_9ACTN|nr:PepSY domain-containing protein [Nonomuraea solani]SEF67148.1 Peptidase propeptide and YPEB domain-containing protein [Nonomuraea solani]